MPLFSICIPTYNRAEILRKTLNSIVSQQVFLNTNDVEIVISNNCSTDNTDEVAREFESKFPEKVKYINQPEPVFPDEHNFKVIQYGSGLYCKVNNDTCMYLEGSLDKIIDYIKNGEKPDIIFFLNQKSKDKNNKYKVDNLNEFVKTVSYQCTWIGAFCVKKEVFLSLKEPLRYKYLKCPQVDIYAQLFELNHRAVVWKEQLLFINVPPKKGGDYNICELFGKNYFTVLYEYTNKHNGITKSVIAREKLKILPFINEFYFDFKNRLNFEKTGYLKYMLPNYKYSLRFYIAYLWCLVRILLSFLYKTEKDENYRTITFLAFIKFKLKRKTTSKRKRFNIFGYIYNTLNYMRYCAGTSLNLINKKEYVEITDKPFERKEKDTKLIAFYLPQYHTIPLNDKYHGKGFTDWKNAASAIPQFTGHYQPHLPADCGFYDLSNPKVLEEQSQIAQKYGIYGFCYHYYWFSGDRLLEKPIFDMLNNKNVTIPFCLCWANENWSKLWDGGDREIIKPQTSNENDGEDREIIKPQTSNENDGEKFFNDILPFFKDERYIKIGNKPVLIIYRPDLFTQAGFIKFVSDLRNCAKQNGFDDLFILTTNYTLKENPSDWNLDGVVEFPPHGVRDNGIKKVHSLKTYGNPNFAAKVFDMKDYVNKKRYLYKSDFNIFKGLFPSWDNTARKAYSGASVFYGLTPDIYKKWLRGCIEYTKQTKDEKSQFVFINAWNEWAEGAHLEADMRYGYTYLQATKEVLEEVRE